MYTKQHTVKILFQTTQARLAMNEGILLRLRISLAMASFNILTITGKINVNLKER